MLGTILKDPEHSVTFRIACERPEIQDANIFNSTIYFCNILAIPVVNIKLIYSKNTSK